MLTAIIIVAGSALALALITNRQPDDFCHKHQEPFTEHGYNGERDCAECRIEWTRKHLL